MADRLGLHLLAFRLLGVRFHDHRNISNMIESPSCGRGGEGVVDVDEPLDLLPAVLVRRDPLADLLPVDGRREAERARALEAAVPLVLRNLPPALGNSGVVVISSVLFDGLLSAGSSRRRHF